MVILDDLVLDVTEFMDNHPGGKFLLEHNKGRDISKFFYGGYAMDGNLVANGAISHTHSNVARAIVESLTIARLLPNKTKIMKENMEVVPTFSATIKGRTSVN